MKVSVVIPTHNSMGTIRGTIESVLMQSVTPNQILVLDDGSTDGTVAMLESYEPELKILRQENRGVAHARNTLCQRAEGDFIAFLDHDDIWHPQYLERQMLLYKKYPEAVGFFTGHVNLVGYNSGYKWKKENDIENERTVENMDGPRFSERYNTTTGDFASMSYFCIPAKVIKKIGNKPFRISGVDDAYFFNLLPLLGNIIYDPTPLVAYRILTEGQSANRAESLKLLIDAYRILDVVYKKSGQSELHKLFNLAFASKRRHYAKILMGIGMISEARTQLKRSYKNCKLPVSLAKSTSLLICTYAPGCLQPSWGSEMREFPMVKK